MKSKNFYKIFHSYRWVRDEMVIRIQKRLTPTALERLNDQFDHLVATGHIRQCEALREEVEETTISSLPRLVFTPNKRDFAMFRLLINAINDSAVIESESATTLA